MFCFLRHFLIFFGLIECVAFFFLDQALEIQNDELRHRELLLLIGVGVGTVAGLFMMWHVRKMQKKNPFLRNPHQRVQTITRVVSAFLIGFALFSLFTLANVPGCTPTRFWSDELAYVAHCGGGMRGFYQSLSIASGAFACLIDRYIAFFEWLNKAVSDKDK